jgi:hypothetical protein
MRSSAIFVLFLWVGTAVFGQERSEIIQQRIEFISEQNESEEIDLTNLFDQLNYYYSNPVNLNNTDAEELRSLGLLTEVQITSLLLHRKQFGRLISIYELQSLAYWDLATIQLVLPFIRVDDRLDQLHITLREAIQQGRFEWYGRYQRTPEHKSGYDDVPDSVKAASSGYYYGNADRYYTRFRYTYRTNISVGFTGEKDPGEQFFNGSQRSGFDFYSGHAFFKGGKYLRSVVAGDYLVQIGQGLNTWSGYAFGKTADIFASKKTASLLRPYTSVDENRFFRGGAAVAGYGDFSLLAFYSQKRIDGAGIADSLTDDIEFITTIDLSGLRRTSREIAKKNQLGERVFGSYLHYTTPRFNAGLAVVDQSYSAPLQRDSIPYNLFAFRGIHTTAISGDYNWVLKNMNFFGESSYSTHSKAWAQLHGVMIVPDPRVSFSVIYRNYGRAYYSFYNNGFSEGSNTQNENGLFAGWKVKLSSAWTVNSYVDIFRFPWLKYQVDAPSKGYELLFQPGYRPTKELEIYGRFRQQVRQKNSHGGDGTITTVEDVVQRNYRLNLSYKVTEAISIKSRLEYITIDRAGSPQEEGWLLSQDLVVRPKSSAFDVALRYALFDTDSYDSRIYTFENNALYVFSSPSYYYQGSRAYILVRYSFLKVCDLWVRYGTFLYSNRTSLSSGAEEIVGNRKSDITVQLRIAL